MKFFLAVAVYVIIGMVLAMGISHALHGDFWLLGAAGLAYLLALIKLGCLPAKPH